MRGSVGRDNEMNPSGLGERGASQRVLLLVLLLVVVLFAYVYFFTGIIIPREEQAPPKPVQPQIVKKPIPSRTEKGAAEKEVVAPQQKAKEEPPAAVAKAPEPAKPQATKAQTAPAPRTEKSKAAPAAAPKQAPVPAAAPAKAKQQDKNNTGKGAPAKTAIAPAKTVAAPAKTASGAYTLLVGDFVLDRDIKRTEAKLKKAGIGSFSIRKGKKTEPMHRLHVADFADRKGADAELKNLLKVSAASFVLPANGKYALYAGSYFQEAQAVKEKERIVGKGGKGGKDMKVTIEKAEVKVPVKVLSAGSFSTKEKAVKEAERLKKQGVTVMVTAVKK